MDFVVRFIVRVGCDYYYHHHHRHHNHRYHYHFTQFTVIIHENSINDLKILKCILNVLTVKMINQFKMTQNRALTN